MKNKLYESAGVSLEKGYKVIQKIKKHVQKTHNFGTMDNIGSFAGLFDLTKLKIKNPLLVSSTDGVGTKLLLAIQADIHNHIGQDLVAMCINDLLCLGAKPLFFLDYFATSNLKPNVVEKIIKNICQSLIKCQTTLLGGETAEMPGLYAKHHYDLAGFVVGVVDKQKIINGPKNVKNNDVLIALPSSGLHSNGFSLVRKVFFQEHKFKFQDKLPYNKNKTLIKELLTPTKIYFDDINLLLKNQIKINGIAHITGGGFFENIPRMLNDKLTFKIDFKNIKVLPIFKLIQKLTQASQTEMFNTFNMGVGMVIATNKINATKILKLIKNAYIIGKVINK